MKRNLFVPSVAAVLLSVVVGCSQSGTAGGSAAQSSVELLNVSYDPTRELWKELNARFIADYEKQHQVSVSIRQSHAGSATQARAIVDGLEADVATLSLWIDTDVLRKQGLIAEGWEDRLPNRSLPYTSTVVFVVRKGNPKGIKDWPDLLKDSVQIVTPNPKTSGNGKLSFLAAWGWVLKSGGDEAAARKFVTEMYRRTPVLDTGARGATTTFSRKGIGDVHLTMESEAYLEVEEAGGALEVVYPSVSILHEPHLAVVDQVVDRRNTRAVAEAYLKSLYTPEAQEIIARHYFRPSDPKVLSRHRAQFPELELMAITAIAPSWEAAQEKFFAEGAIFDSIYQPASSR